MEEIVKIDLPSGAKLEIYPADFLVAKKAYQVVAQELEGLKLDPQAEVDVNLLKDVMIRSVASEAIDAQIWECMKKCTYNGLKITKDTFQPMSAREDYLPALYEVAVVNISPFLKSLFAKFAATYQSLEGIQRSKSGQEKKTA